MQSGSLSGPQGFASAAWGRARAAVPRSVIGSAGIVFLLVLIIANSTVAASWVVSGIEYAPVVALGGTALMVLLAVTPLPWYLCVGFGMVLGPIVAIVVAAPVFRAMHPDDPVGVALVQVWMQRVQGGSAFADNAFVLFVILWLMWVTGAWLAWSVLRWRQPLIGLIPGAAAFSTNVLNWPQNQNGFTLAFIAMTFALLLWTTYTTSTDRARRARMKFAGDAKWDFWESGILATAGLIIFAVLMPPLSTVDRTTTMESSIFTSWAELQQALNHPPGDNAAQGSNGGPGTTGFSLDVRLAGELKRSTAPVFTYTVSGEWTGPSYFRGVDVTKTENGEWHYQDIVDRSQTIPKNSPPAYVETYLDETYASFNVNISSPPAQNADLIFYPGQLNLIDRDTVASEVPNPGLAPPDQLYTIDRLTSRQGSSQRGYTVQVMYPNVFPKELENAGADYPSWLDPYRTLGTGYRDPKVLDMERKLARTIIGDRKTDFDKAAAIEAYFRSGQYRYTLNPGNPRPGEDRIQYFLFDNKQGYCEYFATAMGDMLRLLDIPTRLVNGFGPGSYQSVQNRYTVEASDAHTWVEVYFPGYGWIPFEPTPDSAYHDIQRGVTTGTPCTNETHCAIPTPSNGPDERPTPGAKVGSSRGDQNQSNGGAGGAGIFQLGRPDAGTITRILGVLLALMLVIAAFVARYLRPRTVMGVWQRTLVLARLAGAALRPGETPLELGRRLARLFPEVDSPARALALAFAVAAYAPPDVAEATRGDVMEAWAQLRPLMLRRVAARVRPTRR